MRLRDLVANSLPRMRGRKKKSPPVPGSEVNPAACNVVDKCQQRFSSGTHYAPREGSVERMALAEASWRGNALYRGMETERRGGVEVSGSRMMTRSYTSHGIVASQSAEGFPSGVVMMSQSYDARMAVSEYGGSSTQIAAMCETSARVPEVAQYNQEQQQHFYHCYVHKHSHQHHHHYHHHHHVQPSQPMKPLSQNQQLCSNTQHYQTHKSEPGFFRKSIASFRGIRKQSSKANKEKAMGKQASGETMRCSVCPYPEAGASADRKPADKRPVKPKRKGLKGFSRSKENSEVVSGREKCDQLWFSDNEAQNSLSPALRCDNSGPYHVTMERSRTRECSVESCSSRLYSSRESSCVRETDLTGFDSASLSGYESDLPRSKVHRSRSRIKTNPWLPSPQPSLSGSRRAGSCDIRESCEDMMLVDDVNGRTVPRSASFECQRRPSLQVFTGREGNHTSIQRHRSLTPSDVRSDPCFAGTPRILSQYDEKEVPPSFVPPAPPDCSELNDLSSEPSRSRPTSIVSPNSEFVMLADNLEQLANNISFEYEDLLDSTLESVSACPEDGQASIQELLTDEDSNGLSTPGSSGDRKCKQMRSNSDFLKCSGDGLSNAHSPDSGVGGLGSTDGDDLSSPHRQSEGKTLSMDCSFSETPRAFCLKSSCATLQTSKEIVRTPPQNALSSFTPNNGDSALGASGDYKSLSKGDTASFRLNISKNSLSAEAEASAGVCESDIDNTSYQDASSSGHLSGSLKKNGSPLLRCKTESSNQNSALMVNERLDAPFQPAPRRNLVGNGIVMGSLMSVHDFRSNSSLSKSQLARLSDPSDKRSPSASRPTVLRTGRCGQAASRQLNNIEKVSPHDERGRPWSDEFDFPRNITVSDCIESPTDNFQCEGQFPRVANMATREAPAKALTRQGHISADEENFVQRSFSQADQPVADVDIAENGEEIFNLMECNTERNEFELSEDVANSEMTDACCQTEFDEEFLPWDSQDPLESLDDAAIDASENTRIWLLTGNMQGSADTGYSSLARDSRVITDEDLVLTSEQEERTAAERMSLVINSRPGSQCRVTTSPSRNTLTCEPPKDTALEAVTASTSLPCKEATTASGSSNDVVLQEQDVTSDFDVLVDTDINGNPETLSSSKSVTAVACTTPVPPKSISSNTVNDMFSNIENQFQEIFQQMYPHKEAMDDNKSKHDLSDSSDSTLKSFGSRHSVPDVHQDNVECNQDSETGEQGGEKVTGNSDPPVRTLDTFLNHVYENVPHLKQTTKSPGTQPLVDSSRSHNVDMQRLSNGCDSYNSTADSTKLSFQSENGLGEGAVDIPFIDEDPLSVSSGIELQCASDAVQSSVEDKADYLAFLRDAPLDRPHMKRPLFLVPGVGPVDMSSSNRVCLMQDSPSPRDAKHKETLMTLRDDRETSSLAERVMLLRQEKEMVYRKIQEAQQTEVSRQQQQLQHQRDLHVQRKQALLESLQELKGRLEEQSRKLQAQSGGKL
ncbi:uncharacterized protein LOC101859939 [Aplysia californica]|uniref:Uncharacterized protein LOC101859939 n=1 Tax=Aplysia californica TaxID=6500 RepID=A0ABM0JRW2_APLCA|nr:uncharacterized protein LOC101859939 [Aplysia californica]